MNSLKYIKKSFIEISKASILGVIIMSILLLLIAFIQNYEFI